jgi:primosomal protein N' (replication factor Y)
MPARPEQPSFDFEEAVDDPEDLINGPENNAIEGPGAVSDLTGGDGADPALHVVRVRPDQPAILRLFDYSVPPSMSDQIRIGTMVRIALHGRRVGGWVVADHVDPPAGVTLQPLSKVTGWGPPPFLFDLADWAAWRWAGRPASLLRTASPERAIRAVARPDNRRSAPATVVATDELHGLAAEGLAAAVSIVRLAPNTDPYPILMTAAADGPILVVGPVASTMRRLAIRMRRAGLGVALMPDDWSAARSGGVSVLGTRSAAWAPIETPAAIVVLDEHDESLQQEQAPTWHARDVLVERARRLGVPCVLVSPMPSLEAQRLGPVLVPSRSSERAGWPVVDIIDRRDAPPGEGLFSERFVAAIRAGGRVVCVLNRKGRSRLTGCGTCGALATCENCSSSVTQDDDGTFVCGVCGTRRPPVCTGCGGTRMRNLRAGVTRVREELEALTREPVAELTAESDFGAAGTGTRILIGTEAVLHHVHDAAVVAFLDFDQELLAPRYRASEEALALLVRAARLLGAREHGGRLLVQTRLPDHEVIQSALHADPSRLSNSDSARRELLGYPPHRAMAAISGAAAGAWIDALGVVAGVEVRGPSDGRWLLRAADHAVLCDAIAAVPRPPGRLRIEVDPLRV